MVNWVLKFIMRWSRLRQVASSRCGEVHLVLTSVGFTDSSQCVVSSTVEIYSCWSGWSIPTRLSSNKLHARMSAMIWSSPLTPRSEPSLCTTGLTSLGALVKWTHLINIFIVSIIKTLTMKGGKYTLLAVILIQTVRKLFDLGVFVRDSQNDLALFKFSDFVISKI